MSDLLLSRIFRLGQKRLAIPLGAMLCAGHVAQSASIVGSKHDLSVAGGSGPKAAAEKQVCVFCHTPHRAIGQSPLWNHTLSTATYTPYSSTTAKAVAGQPTGASKLCLSCHDGTVALGMVNSLPAPITMQNGVTNTLSGATVLGTDLSDDHPVSILYDTALTDKVSSDTKTPVKLKPPSSVTPPVRLDPTGQLQCTACHDPHDNQFGSFLVMDNIASAICIKCHDSTTWAGASHNTSSKTWNGSGPNPWPQSKYRSVSDNGCENCHTPHNAGTHQRLLTFSIAADNCFSCHNGNVASKNLFPEFNKPSVHSMTKYAGVHDAAEDPQNFQAHVSCVDCHNPHASTPATALAPNASGPITGTVGMDAAGAVANPILREYELCYRCHANLRNPDQDVYVSHQSPQTNVRLEFDQANASFHPITALGKNTYVPSLIAPWTTVSFMKCTDCHNNDQAPTAGGTGPNGPHGSAYRPILERQLIMTDGDTNSATYYTGNFALCYKCHSEPSILGDNSFRAVNTLGQARGHRFHIVDQHTACTTCHDPHGVLNNAHLINFNTLYVGNSTSLGTMEYMSTGTSRGTCTLTCHGKDHANVTYPMLSAPASSLIRKSRSKY